MKIILGKFKTTYPKGYLCDEKDKKIIEPRQLVTITKPEEKESDVNIGIHMISDCYELKNDLKGIILVSSDTDLTPVVRMVKKEFKNIKILNIRMRKKESQSLQKYADLSKIVRLKNLKNSQLPLSIDGKNYKIKIPTEWKNS